MNKPNRTVTLTHDTQVIEGIDKNLRQYSQLPLAAVLYTPDTLTAFYRSRIEAACEIETAHAAWLASIARYEALNAHGAVVDLDLKRFVFSAFGQVGPELADFGYVPYRSAVYTPEQKAETVARRAATRKARGTMGPKARLAITGETAKAAADAAPVKP